MLNCIFHVIDGMKVVDNEDYEKLLASGNWFDCPNKAKEAREKVEQEILNEPKPKASKAKAKQEE